MEATAPMKVGYDAAEYKYAGVEADPTVDISTPPVTAGAAAMVVPTPQPVISEEGFVGSASQQLDDAYRTHFVEDLRVYPHSALPESDVAIRAPNFQGHDGFEQLKRAVYDMAEAKQGGTSVAFDLRVQDGEVGYYTSRGGRLHLLRDGRHLRAPGSQCSEFRSVSLNHPEIHLPPADDEVVPTFHIIRVMPGEIVTANQGGRPVFMGPGKDATGQPCPGYHLIADDRTFTVLNRLDANQPIIQNGNSYIVNVQPGYFCKAWVSRTNVLLGAGQHRINVANFSIKDAATAMVSVNERVIQHGIIHIIRVPPGQIFKAQLHGKPIMLESRDDPYVFIEPTFRPAATDPNACFVSITQKYIEHASLHEIRLDLGEVALVWLDNLPYILGSAALLGNDAVTRYHIDIPAADPQRRIYKFNSPNFRVVRQADDRGRVTDNSAPLFLHWGREKCITHGPVHILQVRKGELCRVWQGSEPIILQPRDEPYVFNAPSFRLASVEVDGYPAFIPRSANVIIHGTHHIITVPSGTLCRVWHEGEAKILGAETLSLGASVDLASLSETPITDPRNLASAAALEAVAGVPGSKTGGSGRASRTFVIESSNFRLASRTEDGYDAWVTQSDKIIQHGPNAIVTVEDGEVAIVRNQGRREAFGPGRYLLVSPTQVFERHLYTGVRTTRPEELITYDSQRIPIQVRFTITYEIVDPEKAARYQGEGGLDHFLSQACHSCLRSCVNQTHILEMGKSAALSIMAEQKQQEAKKPAKPSAAIADDTGDAMGDEPPAANGFAEQFHAAFEHQNKSLEAQLERVGVTLIDLSIQDWNIQDEKVVTQLEVLAMQNVEAQVNSAKFAAQARTAQLSAEGDAAARIAKARGDAAVKQAAIDAENQSSFSRAQAALNAARVEAEAMDVRSEAEANAIIRKAEAEAKAIQMRGAAEAAAKREQLMALAHTPAPEWMRLLQESCTGVLQGANLTLTPDGFSSVLGMLGAGSPLFAGMRTQLAQSIDGSRPLATQPPSPPSS